MEFLADENFPLVSIQLLRKAGHSVKSIIEDSPGSKDSEVLSCAKDENRIILTFDRDYGNMIYRQRPLAPAGVVYFRFAPSGPEEPAQILLGMLEKEEPVLSHRFTVVERGRIRQRTLPKTQ